MFFVTFLDKVKPYVISEDILVQETVLQALHDYPRVPEEWIVELLKEAFAKSEKLPSILIYLSNQEIKEEALRVILDHIPAMEQDSLHLALRLLDNVEPDLAITYRKHLEQYIPEETWELYELIVNGTEEDVYMEYGQVLNDIENAESFRQDLYIRGKKLAACLVKNGWINEREIDIILAEELESDWFSINGIFHVYMIGLLKHEKYIPLLVGLLGREEDTLLEEVAEALIQFQSDEVVRAVVPYLQNPETMIFAASVVENIKTDLAVEVLIEAYQVTEELEDQELLIEALCHHFSKKALPTISAHMENEYTTSLVDLEMTAYSTYMILGEKHPELMLWKQETLNRELDYRNETQQGQPNNVPTLNTNKVGRNDPCPCGSGKKYKKCCGK
ncbi:SEC-C metal-binding domain-containing protein [Fredinandcohnia sp. 179-A 10B2 NHS]|uniref:SEC-C metal-binding domain-containing protein n=1 Tax=Fredinandcohnia sp. 179-A 10B2 NHS TaxID=3235176 RepID=UPI0039A3989F